MYKCLESINSLYIEKTNKGYITTPCCLFKRKEKHIVKDINELLDNDYINEVREGFKGDWKRPECNDCVIEESIGRESKRQKSLLRGDKGIVSWDLRPGNTCNLKCAMCSPFQSSKWYEDLDVYSKYNGINLDKDKNMRVRESLDWDWIYERCVDKAEKIYIAGGEPFYMKSAYDFLDKLSKHEWNRNHTKIMIQTNGVSNTDNFIEILKRFKMLIFSVSIDGWGSVNELIRYPTQHDKFCTDVKQLIKLEPLVLSFNVTIQAMNLLNIDELVTKLPETFKAFRDKYAPSTIMYNTMNSLYRPGFLSVNCLRPHVVQQVLQETKVEQIKKFYADYKYNKGGNAVMKRYLLDLDAKRGTDSKKTMPWCFE